MLNFKKIDRTAKLYLNLLHLISNCIGLKSLFPIFVGALGIGLQIFAIGAVILYAKHLQSGLPLKLLNFSFEPNKDTKFLFIFSSICLLVLLFSSVLNYFYQKLTIKHSLHLEKYLLEKIMSGIQSYKILNYPQIENIGNYNTSIRILISDSRSCSRAYLIGIQTIIPLIVFILGAVSLMIANYKITLSLIPIMSVYLLFLLKINQFGVDASKKLELNTQRFRVFLKEKLTDFLSLSNSSSSFNETETYVTDDYLNSYSDIIKISHKSAFLNDLLISTSICFVLCLLVFFTLSYNSDWSVVVIYLVSLRYTTSYLKACVGKVSILNRFLPQMRRLIDFLNYLEKPLFKKSPHSFNLNTHCKTLNASIKKGMNINLIFPATISKYNLIEIINVLSNNFYSVKQTPKVYLSRDGEEDLFSTLSDDIDWYFHSTALPTKPIINNSSKKTFNFLIFKNLLDINQMLDTDFLVVINLSKNILYLGLKKDYMNFSNTVIKSFPFQNKNPIMGNQIEDEMIDDFGDI